MLLTAISFAGMGFCTRTLSPEIPAIQTFFIRSIINALVFVTFAMTRSISIFGTHRRDWVIRGLAGTFAGLAYFWGLASIPLSEASALFRTSALFMPFLAFIFLKERLSPVRIGCAILGFIGACFILKPGLHHQGIAPWIVLIGAFLNAIAMVTIRSLTRKEHSVTIILAFSLMATAVGFVFGFNQFVPPTPQQWIWLIAASILGLIGQVYGVLAYKYAEATLVTPISYCEILFLGVLGWAYFGQRPDVYSFFGMALIIVSGIAIVLGSRKRSVEALPPVE